ncbi:MAG: biopolymer transporter ExbD [Pontiellaceae bacterium]|nr:biopolymer transporter ExbD [Pontiellaceae bacterium]
MNLHSKEADEEVEIDMSPMIDMVFLLLIFFIVASKIINDKPPVDLPRAAAVIREPPEDEEKKLVRFYMSISKDKDDERHYYLTSPDKKYTFEEVIDEISKALDRAIAQEKDFAVVIRGDGEVKFEDTQKVMQACAAMGAYNMIFAAKEENK